METSLLIFHVFFISACVYFSYQNGAKQGREEMLIDLLDRRIITETQLKNNYID